MVSARAGKLPETLRRIVAAWTGRRSVGALLAPCLLALFVVAAAPHARAEQQATLRAAQETAYARLVFDFSAMPEYEVEVTTGVLVLTFAEAIAFELDDIAEDMPRYVAAARRDPDGKALRLALVQPVTVNTMEAGKELYLDFLPATWSGPPPGLPPEAMARLERQARLAEQAAREKALKDAGLADLPTVRLEVGQLPTFSRLSFLWDRRIDAEVSRDGGSVSVRFPVRGELDLSGVRGHPPRFVSSASARNTDTGLVVSFQVPHGAAVRAFPEEKSYVVDIAPGPQALAREGEVTEAEQALLAAAGLVQGGEGATQIDGGGDERVIEPVGAEDRVTTSVMPFDPDSVSPRAYADWEQKEAGISVNKVRRTIEDKDEAGAGKPDGDEADETPAKRGPRVGDTGDWQDAAVEEAAAQLGAEVAGETDADDSVVQALGERVGKSVRLSFPFARPVAAAVFQRADTIWLVFDSAQPVNVHGLAEEFSDRFESVQVGRRDKVQFVRLGLARPGLATIEVDERQWSVTIADLLLDPSRPVALTRGFGADGQPEVIADLPDAGQVHEIKDPSIGDTLKVVTAYGPPRGLVKSQDFVQFHALATSHGLAFSPVADDISVTLERTQVRVRREEGLWISAGSVRQYLPGRDQMFDDLRPGFINFAGIRAPGPAKFMAAKQQLGLAAARSDKSGQRAAQLTLARFYTGYGLAAEALGVLDYLAQTDPDITRDPLFNATRGIANVLMGRAEEAHRDFAVHGLSQSRDIALWRGLAAAMRGNWRAAQVQIAEGESVLPAYPSDLRARFLLAATRAALENRDMGEAELYLQQLADNADTPKVQAELLMLAAWLYELRGRMDEALQGYSRAIAMEDIRPVAAEAKLRQVELLRKLGRIDNEETTDQLERLVVSWRGDETELGARKILASVYAQKGDYRHAFEQVKMAVQVDPDSDITRHIQDDMALVFQELFLDGKSEAMQPVEALALYYDFSDLTPVGRLGDDMIRKLSDRLIEVDLLDQAVELLTHQVDNRLHGAAQSQVAARLAFAHMLNREPREALKVIARTRWSQLPRSVQRQRNLIEARALAEIGRTELALDLLDTMGGSEDILRIRAEALWHGHQWGEAAQTFEEQLGRTWQVDGPLSPAQRFDVMRAAIAYSLAGDQRSLDRLSQHYAQKMSDSPDAHAFEIVTQPIKAKTAAFGELARSIAGTDSLKAFLAEFRKQYGNGGDAAEGEGATAEATPAG